MFLMVGKFTITRVYIGMKYNQTMFRKIIKKLKLGSDKTKVLEDINAVKEFENKKQEEKA